MGIADPGVYVTQMGRDNNEEEKEEEEDFTSPLDFSTPPEPAPNTFFLRSSLAPEEKFASSLHDAATYYAVTKKMPAAR